MESRDYFALGHLLVDMIAPFLMPVYTQASGDQTNWKELQGNLDQMCSRNPNKRISSKTLLETSFFKNSVLIDVVETFKEIRGIPHDMKHRIFR